MTQPTPPAMTPADVEQAYNALAQAIDRAGPHNEALFFAKLALLLAHEIGDPGRFDAALDAALQDLPSKRVVSVATPE